MAKCQFCKREFPSQQSVRAHLRHCVPYRLQKGKSVRSSGRSPPPSSQEAHLKRLVQEASWNPRPPPQMPGSLHETRGALGQKDTECPKVSRPRQKDSELLEEARRQRERQQQEQNRKIQEQQFREQKIRQIIQQVKTHVVDWHWQWWEAPTEAKVKVKMAIERTLLRMNILDLPYHEIQQIGAAVRDRIFARYRKNQSVHPVQQPTQEVIMPRKKVLSGWFFCPQCDAEYELDRTPEKEARCPTCGVRLEKDEENDDDASTDD